MEKDSLVANLKSAQKSKMSSQNCCNQTIKIAQVIPMDRGISILFMRYPNPINFNVLRETKLIICAIYQSWRVVIISCFQYI